MTWSSRKDPGGSLATQVSRASSYIREASETGCAVLVLKPVYIAQHVCFVSECPHVYLALSM